MTKTSEERRAYRRDYMRRYSKTSKNKSYRKAHRLRTNYGITVEQKDRLLAEQGNVCAICHTPNPPMRGWCVDHDHSTHEVRGILCSHCNLMLGHALDKPDVLIAGAAYLRRKQ